jgi:hypothetical protein
MVRRAVVVLAVLAWGSLPLAAQDPPAGRPDTLLVFKNGSEVRGTLLGMQDGQYTLRLPDGRTMAYPAADVERMERLSDPTAAAAPAPPPAPAPTAVTCNTFITEKDVDKAFYRTMKEIKVSKKWYGSTAEMYGDLAQKARKAGADAVINARTWHAPSGFSWAAPHAGGMAVKWTPAGRAALPNLEGRCY